MVPDQEFSTVKELRRARLGDRLPESSSLLIVRPVPWWKRGVDFVGAFVGLLLLSPLFMIVAILIKWASPNGPVFFRQRRFGLGGKPFQIYKFRTMHTSMEGEHMQHVLELSKSNGVLEKPDISSRLIWLGQFYRDFAIDELPQLVNILRGEMSLVGPRPDVLDVRDYEPWQRERFTVLPGVTGPWQVSGKNRCTFDQMMEFDVEYARKNSFWKDAGILLRTVYALLFDMR